MGDGTSGQSALPVSRIRRAYRRRFSGGATGVARQRPATGVSSQLAAPISSDAATTSHFLGITMIARPFADFVDFARPLPYTASIV